MLRRCLAVLSLAALVACAESPTAPTLPAVGSAASPGAVTASATPTPSGPDVTAEFDQPTWAVIATNHTAAPLYVVATWERAVPGGWQEFSRAGQVVAPGQSARLTVSCGWAGYMRAGVLGQPGLHWVWQATTATASAPCLEAEATPWPPRG